MRHLHGTVGVALLLLTACAPTDIRKDSLSESPGASVSSVPPTDTPMPALLSRTALTEEQKHILYDKGTERPFTSPLLDEHRTGTFVAADTGEPLFRSEAKFDSGTGWPSFFEPISPRAVILREDDSWGMGRTEVLTRSGSHLGHVFDDGPEPTGKRYCINGLALRFVPDEE